MDGEKNLCPTGYSRRKEGMERMERMEKMHRAQGRRDEDEDS